MAPPGPPQEIISGAKNFWLYSKTTGYDLTHPSTPTSPFLYPRIPLHTSTAPVTIHPSKTAIIIIDLQNYFLSPALGRPHDATALKAVDALLHHAIPACRKAGILIVFLGWGLTEQDIEEMPPSILRGFAAGTNFKGERRMKGLGSEIGPVRLDEGWRVNGGWTVDGGRVLMREQWNSEPYTPVAEALQPQDMTVYKNRLSGFWGGTEIEERLNARGIRTLLFAGVNTDQCVGGSLQDAFTRGWDYLLLRDGCATTSPGFAQQCIEYNCELNLGFLLSCEDFAKGVDNMQTAPDTGL